MTYAETCEKFLAELVRRPNTIRNYRRALTLFIGDHDDAPRFNPPPLKRLAGDDKALLVQFTQWLLGERGLSPATVRLYISAVRQWFEWMSVNDYLEDFPLQKALWALDKALAGSTFKLSQRLPAPPDGMERLIHYYRSPEYAGCLYERLKARPRDKKRLAVEMLRNRALMRCLAETGGRISEVLSLDVVDFPPAAFEQSGVWRVEVRGKGGHRYDLRFMASLSDLQAYLEARDDTYPALFAAHSKRYAGRRLSRQAAWKVVNEAATSLGMGKVSPHDFRHWRATQLVNAGQPLDVVQDYLGHRSVETTRRYYARTKEERVDEAMQKVGL